MLDERMRALMREFNPWWEGGKVKALPYRRLCFGKLEKYLPTRQAIALVGLRRVGKTELMRQAIGMLLEKTGPKNVFYFLLGVRGEKAGSAGRASGALPEDDCAGWEEIRVP